MSSSADLAGLAVPITSLQYRDISARRPREILSEQESIPDAEETDITKESEASLSEIQVAARIEQERANAVAETEQRLRREYEQRLMAAQAPIAALISGFEEQRTQYYAQVEGEIVHLALSIAAKILHREAQVDPLLLAALVRLAVERMSEGSPVTVRLGRGRGESWKQYFAGVPSMSHVAVVEDEKLSEQDCMLETELGTANFGLDSQLKEIERGFFDLLALRPTSK